MAQVDTVLRDFILNVLSDEEFKKLAEKDGNQLYFTDLIEYYTKEEARALMTLFRGQFANWESVPTSIADYASDFAGSKTPTQNNIMVVKDASGYATDACDILSHVQSTGTQYINLGIIPTVGMKYVAKFQASNSTTGTIFGTDGCDMHVYQGDKNPVTEVNIGTSTLNTIGVSSGFDVNYELTVKEKGVVSKASSITLSNPYSGDLPTTEMYLFAKNTADVATNLSACIVKGFKVYEGETLLMDLVPARRVLDGAIGFVDITTNVFYENLGADPLIAGNVVSGNETPADTTGSWLFIYNGKWNDNGKSGWTPAFALGGGSGDGYSKAEIDNKIRVINESIDAQADAIAKTRDDMNEKDSELESMLNAHATELSTLRGNQASLGDQVSGIEAKIPESASETNPLITKQQLLDEEMDIREDMDNADGELQTQITAQAGAIADKQDKLVAGDNITIVNNVISATGGSINAGVVVAFAGTTPPAGWLKCDGSAISRTLYSDLFTAIGTKYGSGDGSTTFNLPTQSVLPLGSEAPVAIYGNGKSLTLISKNNTLVSMIGGMNVESWQGFAGTGAYTGITTPGTPQTPVNPGVNNGTLGLSTDPTISGISGRVDLTRSTGGQAIACIKY